MDEIIARERMKTKIADGIGILSAIVRYTAGNILKAGGFLP